MKINIEGFASNMGLDSKDIESLYTTFFSEMDENIDQLKIANQNKDYPSVVDIMHNIKGVCLNIELLELGKYAEQIYSETKNANYSNLEKFLLHFDSEIKVISKIVSDFYKH